MMEGHEVVMLHTVMGAKPSTEDSCCILLAVPGLC